jgi:hypothetical protein
VSDRLLTLGARQWQVDLTRGLLVEVIAAPPPSSPSDAAAIADNEPEAP